MIHSSNNHISIGLPFLLEFVYLFLSFSWWHWLEEAKCCQDECSSGKIKILPAIVFHWCGNLGCKTVKVNLDLREDEHVWCTERLMCLDFANGYRFLFIDLWDMKNTNHGSFQFPRFLLRNQRKLWVNMTLKMNF